MHVNALTLFSCRPPVFILCHSHVNALTLFSCRPPIFISYHCHVSALTLFSCRPSILASYHSHVNALTLFSNHPPILISYQSHVKCTYPVLVIVSSAYPYLVSQSRQCTYPVLVSPAYLYFVSLSRSALTLFSCICLSLFRSTVTFCTYTVLASSAYPYLVSQSRPAPTLFSCPHRVQPTPQVKVGELLSPAVHHLVPLGRHPQPQAVEVAAAGVHAHHQRGGHTDRQAQCHLAGGTTSLIQGR